MMILYMDYFQHGIAAHDGPSQNSLSSFYAPVLHVCLHWPHSCYWWPQSNKNVPPAFINPLINYMKSLYKTHMLFKPSYHANTLLVLTCVSNSPFSPWAAEPLKEIHCNAKGNTRNLPTRNASLVFIHWFPLFERTMNQKCNRAFKNKFKFHFIQTIVLHHQSQLLFARKTTLHFRGFAPTGILDI